MRLFTSKLEISANQFLPSLESSQAKVNLLPKSRGRSYLRDRERNNMLLHENEITPAGLC